MSMKEVTFTKVDFADMMKAAYVDVTKLDKRINEVRYGFSEYCFDVTIIYEINRNDEGGIKGVTLDIECGSYGLGFQDRNSAVILPFEIGDDGFVQRALLDLLFEMTDKANSALINKA